MKTLLCLLLFCGAAHAQQIVYSVIELAADTVITLAGSMSMNRPMPWQGTGMNPAPTVTAWAGNHSGAMVGQLTFGNDNQALLWADGKTYIRISAPLVSADYIVLYAMQIGDDGTIVSYGLAQDSVSNLDYRLLLLIPQLQAQLDGEIADVAYLNMIDNQVQTQRDANWNRLVYLNSLANQLQAQVAKCRANAGKC